MKFLDNLEVLLFDTEQSGMYDELDDSMRDQLVGVLAARNRYWGFAMEANRMRIELLRNYTQKAEQELAEFTAEHVLPAREQHTILLARLLTDAVDGEKLASSLPMAMMFMSQAINLPLILNAAGLDSDQAIQAFGAIKQYFGRGA